MGVDKRIIRKILKEIIKNIDKSVGDIYNGIEDDLCYVVMAFCDAEKFKKKMKELESLS